MTQLNLAASFDLIVSKCVTRNLSWAGAKKRNGAKIFDLSFDLTATSFVWGKDYSISFFPSSSFKVIG